VYSRLLTAPEQKNFFLFGPRGTGKSTWVRNRFPDAVYLDLLNSSIYNELLAAPARLENFIPRDPARVVVIDEVQRIPELLNEVHRLIEARRQTFVLTGSSARGIRRRGVNLLAGRALTRSMFPLTAYELGVDFDLRRFLKYGGLPSVYNEPSPKEYLASYVTTYLREEVQQEGLTRNLGAFSRFLEAASFSQGQVLNVSAVSRECAVERKVVEHYFGILQDLLLCHRLPVFTKRAKRKTVAHQKFYFFDVGVYQAVRPRGPLDATAETDGPALETLFLQELLAYNSYYDLGYTAYFWRTRTDVEVDFVVYGEKGLLAFEVKLATKLRREDTKGLRRFLADYPMARAYLVYCGDHVMREDDIAVLPVGQCLKMLPDLLQNPERSVRG
jgi:predicted AAA+ superfamily ATPase